MKKEEKENFKKIHNYVCNFCLISFLIIGTIVASYFGLKWFGNMGMLGTFGITFFFLGLSNQ